MFEKLRTMKTENKMMLISAACGILAAIAGYASIAMKENEIRELSRPVKIILAAKYIAANSQVTREMLKEGELPAKFVSPAVARDFNDIKGYIAIAPFVENEPLMINKLSKKAEQLSSNVPTGLRAIALPVDEVSGCGYMIKPGDVVDVLLTYEKTMDKKPYTVTSTILQCALVIAVGAGFDGDDTKKYSSVTLAVSPQEAQLLAFAGEKGRFTLLLRPAGETDRGKTGDMTFENMIKMSNDAENMPARQEIKMDKDGDGVVRKRETGGE
jgi:pilus assembly protein CpaB